jgi:hypothetical protein
MNWTMGTLAKYVKVSRSNELPTAGTQNERTTNEGLDVIFRLHTLELTVGSLWSAPATSSFHRLLCASSLA